MLIGKLQININNFRIADVDTGSVIAVGNNYFYDWKTYSKANNGFGRLSGDSNRFTDFETRVDDPDVYDLFSCEMTGDPSLESFDREEIENEK